MTAPAAAWTLAGLVGGMLLGPLLVLGWALASPAGCASVAIPVLFAIVLSRAVFEQRVARRRCLAGCWFEGGSALYRLLHGRIVAGTVAALAAVVGTAALMAAVALADILAVAALAADGMLVAFLYIVFAYLARTRLHVRPGFARIFAVRATAIVNTLVMLAVLVTFAVNRPVPAYIDPHLDLAATLDAAVAGTGSACAPLAQVLAAAKEGEAFGWWLMLRANETVDSDPLRWLAWGLFLSGGTLGLWAYGTLCARAVAWGSRRVFPDE